MENEVVVFSQIEPALLESLKRGVHAICDANTSDDTGTLTNKIADELIETARALSENFKYVINCSVMESGADELCTYGTAFWDSQTDGCVKFTVQKNNHLVLVTAFVVAL